MTDKRIGLTVDWDFFTEVPTPSVENGFAFDWGASETWSPALNLFIWQARYSDLYRNGLLGEVRLSPEAETFWPQITVAPGVTALVSDSHAAAYDWAAINDLEEVWSFDAHHDFGYEEWDDFVKKDEVCCDDWAMALATDYHVTTHVRYPMWKNGAMDDDTI
jgi:hypothetical protein